MSEQAGFSFQSGWKRWAVKGNGIGRGLGGEQTALGRVMDGGNVVRSRAGGPGAGERCPAPARLWGNHHLCVCWGWEANCRKPSPALHAANSKPQLFREPGAMCVPGAVTWGQGWWQGTVPRTHLLAGQGL